MDAQTAYLDRLRPAGGKRSSKRDLIVSVFLRQNGHLSADDLVDLMREEDQKISRATVYRALQWMVDAGIARKVDFGDGRFRFEHAYRQRLPLLLKGFARITNEGAYANAYACDLNATGFFPGLNDVVPIVVDAATPGNDATYSPRCRNLANG